MKNETIAKLAAGDVGILTITCPPGKENGIVIDGRLLVWVESVKGNRAIIKTQNFRGFSKVARVRAIAKRVDMTPEDVVARLADGGEPDGE